VFPTVEVKWFYEGLVPPEVLRWFYAGEWEPDEPLPRTDYYLLSLMSRTLVTIPGGWR